MFNKWGIAAAMLTSGLVLTGSAYAQREPSRNYSPSSELRETRSGSGQLTLRGGKDEDLREVTVELRRGGAAHLVFRGRNSTHTYDGRWNETREGVSSLNLTGQENGREAKVTGSIATRRGMRIALTGFAGQTSISLNFDADGNSGSGRPNNGGGYGDGRRINDLDSSQSGDGKIRIDGGTDRDIDKVRVSLDSNRRAEVIFYNNGAHSQETFTGTWSQSRDNEDVRLDLSGEFGRQRVTLTGSLNLRTKDRGKYDRLSLTGRAGRRSVTVNFSAKG